MASFIDDTDAFQDEALAGLYRLLDVIESDGGSLSVVLAGWPKLTDDLHRPAPSRWETLLARPTGRSGVHASPARVRRVNGAGSERRCEAGTDRNAVRLPTHSTLSAPVNGGTG